MRVKLVIAALALLGCAVAAQAQRANPSDYRYKWRDGTGLLHYSDSLTAEAMKYGYDVVNDRGMTVRHVPRQLTPEERKAAQAEAARTAAARRASERQRQADLQLLAAYPDEDAFRASQHAEIDDLVQHMRTTRLNLRAQEQNLADLLAHAADIERTGKDVPKFLVDRIAEQRQAVAGQRATLDRQEAAKVQAEHDAEKQLQRYRKLRAEMESRYGGSQ